MLTEVVKSVPKAILTIYEDVRLLERRMKRVKERGLYMASEIFS